MFRRLVKRAAVIKPLPSSDDGLVVMKVLGQCFSKWGYAMSLSGLKEELIEVRDKNLKKLVWANLLDGNGERSLIGFLFRKGKIHQRNLKMSENCK